MEKEFVSYEQAVKLKELGFNEPCYGNYNNLTDKTRFVFGKTNEGCITWNKVPGTNDIVISNERILAPLKQQVFRWFREKFNIDSHIEKYLSSEDAIEYFFMANDKESVNFETYEEAENKCVNHLISLIEAKD